MTAAVPINRHWVIVLNNGDIVIDWGAGIFQDILSGKFLSAIDQTASHAIQDDECSWLQQGGYIQGFDSAQVYVSDLPQQQKPPIE